MQALLRQAHGAYEQFVELAAKNLQDGLLQVLSSEDPGFVADFIAQNSSIVYQDKQKILEQPHPVKRLELTVKLLAKELEILQLENEISEKVQQNVNKGQRDYYLREQMHVIREELGEEDDEADSEGYQEKIRALKLPEQTETKLLKEARRLGKQQQNSAEAAVIRNYLDLVLELPWNTRTKERLDVKAAEKILDEDHFGLEPVKKRILETLAVRQLAPELPGQILCLVGPPGVGKTSIAISIARALNRRLARISLGGVHDEAEIRGHRKTYIGAMPGRIMTGISQAKSKNALLLLDEIDKLGSDYKGDPSSALLEVRTAIWTSGEPVSPGWVAYCSMIAVFSSLRIIVCFHLSKIISHCLSCRYGRIARVKTRLSPGTERRGSGALRQLIKNTTRHPRVYGTYVRLFERYVRRGVLSPEQAVRKVTALPAARLRLPDKGMLAPGMDADVNVFALEGLHEAGTYGNPRQSAQGMEQVFLAGEPAILHGERTDNICGKVLERVKS